jgi:hypothetical protein
MASEKRYLLCPGYVTSKNDGQRHFINAYELTRLYGVDPRECVAVPHNRPGWLPPEGLIPLSPRYDGNYRLPEAPDGE